MTEFDRLVLEEVPDAVILVTPDGKVVHWTRGAESVFGFTSGEALGRILSDLVIPKDRIDEERTILETQWNRAFAIMNRSAKGRMVH